MTHYRAYTKDELQQMLWSFRRELASGTLNEAQKREVECRMDDIQAAINAKELERNNFMQGYLSF